MCAIEFFVKYAYITNITILRPPDALLGPHYLSPDRLFSIVSVYSRVF